jgi:hypothetical protein
VFLLLAASARIALVFTHGDLSLENEWNPIGNDLLTGRGFAYFSVNTLCVVSIGQQLFCRDRLLGNQNH